MGKRNIMNTYIKKNVLETCVNQRYRLMSTSARKPSAMSEEEAEKWTQSNRDSLVKCERTACRVSKHNCGHLIACYFPDQCEHVTPDNYDSWVDAKSKRPV